VPLLVEMYLDEEGHKVSKSIGRGVGVEQWRRYAPIEVLKYFLILNPRRARKLFLESIPQYTDEYLEELRKWGVADERARRNSPPEFVLQSQSARAFRSDLSFAMIINVVSALGTTDFDLIMNYLRSYDPNIEGDWDTTTMIASLVTCAINYYLDFVAPTKRRYVPTDGEREQLLALKVFLDRNAEASAEEIEKTIYDLGRANYDKPGKIFPLLYRVILWQERGPRLGAFIRIVKPFHVSDIIAASLAATS
jgi:lysyl-tRNA synthetase class 1